MICSELIRAHHRSIQTFAPNRKTQVEMILFLVVESGAIFGVVQVCDDLLRIIKKYLLQVCNYI